MKIDPSLAGLALKEHETEVEWRQTTNYAAAVEDPNQVYFDDLADNGLAAHPMFPVALTWPILSRLDKYFAGEFPVELLMTQVHYSEHLMLHRLIRPEDKLTISGSLLALLPHRAGTHAVLRLKARDKGGAPVFTEYTGALLRGVSCGEGAEAGEVPRPPRLDLPDPPPEPLWAADIPIDPTRSYVYDGCSDIVFPIHTSPAFARMVGLPGIILQGTATLAYAVREVVNREAGGDPHRVKEIACNFSGMVIPGNNIEVLCTGRKRLDDGAGVLFTVVNHQGKQAIRNGYVKI